MYDETSPKIILRTIAESTIIPFSPVKTLPTEIFLFVEIENLISGTSFFMSKYKQLQNHK